jgi:hypothetical protein
VQRNFQHPATLRQWVPDGRRLVAIDLENLIGGSDADTDLIRAGVEEVRALVGATDHDVWVWACGPRLFEKAMTVLRTRVSVRPGENGADELLCEELDPAVVPGRFSSVVLGSGDGRAFVTPVRHLAAAGVPTDLIGRARSTSHALRAASRSFTPLSLAQSSQWAVAA